MPIIKKPYAKFNSVLAELKTMDKRRYHYQHLNRMTVKNGKYYAYHPHLVAIICPGATAFHISRFYSAFGKSDAENDRYAEPDFWKSTNDTDIIKCGVEVVGLKPFAAGRTYSNFCLEKIVDFKKRCNENNIKYKSSWQKTDYIKALMSV